MKRVAVTIAAFIVLATLLFASGLFRSLRFDDDSSEYEQGLVTTDFLATGESSTIPGNSWAPTGASSAGVPPSKKPNEDVVARSEVIAKLKSIGHHLLFLNYGYIVSQFDERSVPVLRNLLKEEEWSGTWLIIARLILWLSDDEDELSADAVMAYLKNSHAKTPYDDVEGEIIYSQKMWLLEYLGRMKSATVNDTLRGAVTREGAEDIAREWFGMSKDMDPEIYEFNLYFVQNRAMYGLVLSQNASNVAIVGDKYERMVHSTMVAGYQDIEITEEMIRDISESGIVVSAMAMNDAIVEMGIDEYMTKMYGGKEDPATEHIERYMGVELDDGREIWNSCPTCGERRVATE